MGRMQIDFVGSFERLDQLPGQGLPEFAFIGRSNVGKSSLINMLTGRKQLAYTSATPGKTQLMNLYQVNDEFVIVDLPGYGYAQLGKAKRRQMELMVRKYLSSREPLFLVFLLLDCRVKPQQSDMDMLNWLGEQGIPVALVFTKTDKVTPAELQKNLAVYTEKILEAWETLPPSFQTSSVKSFGRDEVLGYIAGSLSDHKET